VVWGDEKDAVLVFHCPGSFLSDAHPGERETLRVQALEECAFYHGVALPNTSFDGRWSHPCSLQDGKASINHPAI